MIREEDRPSGKRPRRPTAFAETQLPTRPPWIAPLNIVRIVVQNRMVPKDNVKSGTSRLRYWALSTLDVGWLSYSKNPRRAKTRLAACC